LLTIPFFLRLADAAFQPRSGALVRHGKPSSASAGLASLVVCGGVVASGAAGEGKRKDESQHRLSPGKTRPVIASEAFCQVTVMIPCIILISLCDQPVLVSAVRKVRSVASVRSGGTKYPLFVEIAREMLDQLFQFGVRCDGSSGISGGLASAMPFDHS
jgi:hypothetical protein